MYTAACILFVVVIVVIMALIHYLHTLCMYVCLFVQGVGGNTWMEKVKLDK